MKKKLFKILAVLSLVFGLSAFSSPGTADAACNFNNILNQCRD